MREVESRVAQLLKSPQARRPRADRDVARLEEEWSERLGTTVQIKSRGKRGGRLLITYRTLDELDQLLAKLASP